MLPSSLSRARRALGSAWHGEGGPFSLGSGASDHRWNHSPTNSLQWCPLSGCAAHSRQARVIMATNSSSVSTEALTPL